MSSLINSFDIGSLVKGVTAVVPVSIGQTSAGAATTQDGITVDRNESGRRRYYSCAAVAFGALTAGSSMKAASLSVNFQHSSDGTSWDNYSTGTVPTAAVWGATSSGNAVGTTGGTAYGAVQQKVNLNGARRYVRMQISTPTFSDCSSGSGTFNVAGAIVFGGADELPAQ